MKNTPAWNSLNELMKESISILSTRMGKEKFVLNLKYIHSKMLSGLRKFVPKISMHKKWSFSLRVSSVNVTKSAGNCGFSHIDWRNPSWEIFCAAFRQILWAHSTIILVAILLCLYFYIFSKAKLKSHLISCKEKKAGVGDFFVGGIVGI